MTPERAVEHVRDGVADWQRRYETDTPLRRWECLQSRECTRKRRRAFLRLYPIQAAGRAQQRKYKPGHGPEHEVPPIMSPRTIEARGAERARSFAVTANQDRGANQDGASVCFDRCLNGDDRAGRDRAPVVEHRSSQWLEWRRGATTLDQESGETFQWIDARQRRDRCGEI